MNYELRDTKLILCNNPSLRDLPDDDSRRKLKHNVVNSIALQKSRRDDTLLTVCFSLRTDDTDDTEDVSEVLLSNMREDYTLFIFHH
jgi:hypothetical protein